MQNLFFAIALMCVFRITAQDVCVWKPLTVSGGTVANPSCKTLNATIQLGGLSDFGSANYLLGMNSGGTGFEYKQFLTSETGASNFTIDLTTANQITFRLPDADGTGGSIKRGVVRTGTQSFSGDKEFKNKLTLSNGSASAPSLIFNGTTSTTGFSYASGGTPVVEAIKGSFSGVEKFNFTSEGRFVVSNAGSTAANLGINVYKDSYINEDFNGQDGGVNVTTYGGIIPTNPKLHTSTFTGRTASGTGAIPDDTQDNQAMAEFTGKGWCTGCGTDGFETSNRGVFGVYAGIEHSSTNTATYCGIKTTADGTDYDQGNHMSLMIDPAGNAGLTYLETGSFNSIIPLGWGGTVDDRFFSIEAQGSSTIRDAGLFIQNSNGSRGVNIWLDNSEKITFIDNIINNNGGIIQTRVKTAVTPVIAITTGVFEFPPSSGTFIAGTNFGTDTSPNNVLTVGNSSNQTQFDANGKITKYADATTSIADGELLIGKNSTSSFEKGTLTGGSGISITNGAGTVTINGMGYTLQFSNAQVNPADATNYFTGLNPQSAGTMSGITRIYIPKTGTIKACYLMFNNNTPALSAEQGSVYIRYDDATDNTVTSAVTNDVTVTVFNNTAMSVPVTAGHFVEIKWLTPTWPGANNPQQVRFSGTIYIE